MKKPYFGLVKMIAENRNKALKWGVSNQQVFYSTSNTVESQFLEPINMAYMYVSFRSYSRIQSFWTYNKLPLDLEYIIWL